MLRLGGVVAAAVLGALGLTGCSPGSPGYAGARVDLPAGWRPLTTGVEPPVRMAADGDGDEHVVVKSWGDPDAAEEEAIWSSVGLADRAGILCRRSQRSSLSDGPVLVCPDQTRRPWMVKLYVVVAERERSALVILQLYADDLDGATEVAAPVVDSFRWGRGP